MRIMSSLDWFYFYYKIQYMIYNLDWKLIVHNLWDIPIPPFHMGINEHTRQ